MTHGAAGKETGGLLRMGRFWRRVREISGKTTETVRRLHRLTQNRGARAGSGPVNRRRKTRNWESTRKTGERGQGTGRGVGRGRAGQSQISDFRGGTEPGAGTGGLLRRGLRGILRERRPGADGAAPSSARVLAVAQGHEGLGTAERGWNGAAQQGRLPPRSTRKAAHE